MEDQEKVVLAKSKIVDLLSDFSKTRKDTLQELQDFQDIIHNMLQRKKYKYTKQYGRKSPNVTQIKAKLRHNRKILDAINAQRQLGEMEIQHPQKGKVQVHGRVVSDNYQGIPNMTVTVDDHTGNNAGIGNARTDKFGYYSILADRESIKRLLETKRKRLFVAVYDKTSKFLRRDDNPI